MDEGNIIEIYKNEMDSLNHGDQLVSVMLYDFINSESGKLCVCVVFEDADAPRYFYSIFL